MTRALDVRACSPTTGPHRPATSVLCLHTSHSTSNLPPRPTPTHRPSRSTFVPAHPPSGHTGPPPPRFPSAPVARHPTRLHIQHPKPTPLPGRSMSTPAHPPSGRTRRSTFETPPCPHVDPATSHSIFPPRRPRQHPSPGQIIPQCMLAPWYEEEPGEAPLFPLWLSLPVSLSVKYGDSPLELWIGQPFGCESCKIALEACAEVMPICP